MRAFLNLITGWTLIVLVIVGLGWLFTQSVLWAVAVLAGMGTFLVSVSRLFVV